MKKRGQITVFIILGLVLLLAIAYFGFIKEKALQDLEKINPELIPVQSYVEACIRNLGMEAVTTLGLNGGYIYFPPEIDNNPETYISRSPTPKYKNPYWWHDGTERVPSEDFMEDQITKYINEHMSACLSDFGAFSSIYDIVEHSGIETIAEIGDSMDSLVDIELRYSIEVKDKFNKTLAEISRFNVELPVRLHAAYTMARTILEVENQQGFIERKVIDLISLDSDIPDTGGPEFRCSKMSWNIGRIKDKIKLLMAHNFDFIKIKGSRFDEDRYLPLPPKDLLTGKPLDDSYNSSYYWSHYVWDIGDRDWSNMRVSFSYDYNWPMHWINDFYIRPNKYPFLHSNSQKGQDMLSFFCMHFWHFTYDIRFPVKVTIVDERTTRNYEYTFMFAFKGSIDHNEPRRESFVSTDFEVDNLVEDEQFCNDLYNTLTIFARENTSSGWEIKDVNLTLACGKFICPLGQTEPDYGSGGTPYWEGLTPYCTLGVLRAEKEGYADSEMFIQTGEDSIYSIYMNPIKTFVNFSVIKHEYSGGTVFPGQEFADGESAIIIIKAKDKNFDETVVYPFDSGAEETQQLELLSGAFEYDVEIYMMKDEEIAGGYRSAWKTGNVDEYEKVRFHVLYQNFVDEEDMALFFSNLESYSEGVMGPELIK